MLVLIWGLRKAEYFCAQDWTTQISLKDLRKFASARTPTIYTLTSDVTDRTVALALRLVRLWPSGIEIPTK
jgi:hypothetical protein